MTKEEQLLRKEVLLKIATQDYPLGTRYRSVSSYQKGKYIGTVASEFNIYPSDGDFQITDGMGGSVYQQGVWAEIINPIHNLWI